MLYAAGALGCFIGAAFPMSDQSPAGPDLGGRGWPVPWWRSRLWLSGASFTRPVVHLAVAAATASKTLLIAFAATPQGEIVVAFGYLWIAVYVGPLLQPPRGLAACGADLGRLRRRRSRRTRSRAPLSAYGIVVVTIWVPVTVLSNLTTKMRRQAATDQLTGLLNRSRLPRCGRA